MHKNKKGFTLQEAIFLALAAFIIIFSYYKILNPLLNPEKEDDAKSSPNFNNKLIPKIQELIRSDKKIDYKPLNYFLGQGIVVIGYNKHWDPDNEVYTIGLHLKKPESCGDKACLCLFKDDPAIEAKPSQPCTKFDKVAYFLKASGTSLDTGYGNPLSEESTANIYNPLPDFFSNGNYKYLVLNGATFQNKEQQIYIEKYENLRGEIIIYLSPIDDDTRDTIYKRKSYINSLNVK